MSAHAKADRLDDLIAMRGRDEEHSLQEHIALHFAKHRQLERGRVNELVVGPLTETRQRTSRQAVYDPSATVKATARDKISIVFAVYALNRRVDRLSIRMLLSCPVRPGAHVDRFDRRSQIRACPYRIKTGCEYSARFCLTRDKKGITMILSGACQ
jgi:hypothetical protein